MLVIDIDPDLLWQGRWMTEGNHPHLHPEITRLGESHSQQGLLRLGPDIGAPFELLVAGPTVRQIFSGVLGAKINAPCWGELEIKQLKTIHQHPEISGILCQTQCLRVES